MGIPVCFYKKEKNGMNIATVWNKRSTNYGANSFVRENGTGSVEFESTEQAMLMLSEAVRIKTVERLDLILAEGRITWVREHQCEICNCEDCAEDDPDPDDCGCDSGDCGNCDDCPGFDINDPRR